MVQQIAIVGAGIGGLTAARHLSSNPSNNVILFEKARIGGRIKTLHLDEINDAITHDVGAEFFLSNQHSLLKELDALSLSFEPYLSKRAILLTNGKSIVFPSDTDSWFQSLKNKLGFLSFARFNISQLKLLNQLIDEFAIEIAEVFNIFKDSPSSDDAFASIKSKYQHLLNITLFDYFISRGVKEQLILDFVDPIFRAIYMLGAREINAFLAALAFGSKKLEVYRVTGGNAKLIERLKEYFDLSILKQDHLQRNADPDNRDNADSSDYNRHFIKERVIAVHKNSDFRYKITTTTSSYMVDAVFLAIPLVATRDIEFTGFSDSEFNHLQACKSVTYNPAVYHYTVRASPNKKVKKLLRHSDTIFTNDPYLYEINKIAYDQQTNLGYFDLTCAGPLVSTTESQIDKFGNRAFADNISNYFIEIDNSRKFNLLHSIHWSPAYPLYTPKVSDQIPTCNKLSPGIFVGTDNIITTMDSAIRVALSFVDEVNSQFESEIRENTPILTPVGDFSDEF